MKKTQKLTLTILATVLTSQMIFPVSYATKATVITETLRVRKAATTDSNVLRNLDAGDEVEILSKEGDWYKISFEGYQGYIAADYVKVKGEVPITTENTDEENSENDSNEIVNNETENENSNQSNETEKTGRVVINKTSNGQITLKGNTNVYILPVLISSPIKSVDKETKIKFIETINNWSNIEIDGVTGWVLNKDINNFEDVKNISEQVNEEASSAVTKFVSVSTANVRKEASTDAEVVNTLSLNSEVVVLSEENDWYKIKNGDEIAYISSSVVSDEKTVITSRSSKNRTDNTENTTNNNIATKKTNSSSNKSENKTVTSAPATGSSTGNAVADYAKQFIGNKYVYGGSGPKSFDCSGFTMYVFKKYGVSLPHDASKQINYGKYVSKENLAPGDLIIFNNYANTSLGHAGIYIGNGKIVHAANSKRGVTTDTITSGYYKARYVEARRLV